MLRNRSAAIGASMLVFAAMLTLPAQAQTPAQPAPQAPEPTDRVVLTTSAGATMGRPEGLRATAAPRTVAQRFVDTEASIAPDADESLDVTGVTAGQRGGDIVRLQRSIDGIPVIGGETVVDVDARGRVRAVISENTAAEDINTAQPTVSRAQAVDTAIADTARANPRLSKAGFEATAPQRWIYDPRFFGADGIGPVHQVWRTEVRHAEDPGVRQLVLVDAFTGSVSLSFNQIAEAKQREICDAANAEAHYPCVSPVRTEGQQALSSNPDVNSAYAFAGDTYDYFAEQFGRDSIDDEGMPLVSTVRWCDGACPYENAFWDGHQMVYGESFASADDVVGHELAHGVTEHSSNLFYYYQSGAINESLSDIFGEFVDLTNGEGWDTPDKRWDLGEDLSIGAIRNMKNPLLYNDPDRMGSPKYVNKSPNLLSWDNGGVHSNSGVGNKFAYLITDGDTFNGQTVPGLGIDKAGQIIYGASQLLTSGADYALFAQTLRQSCSSLVGSEGITQADCDGVEKALLAVEMDDNPVNAPVARAQRCDAGLEQVSAWKETFDDAASTDWTRTGNNWFYDGEQPPQYPGFIVPEYSRGESGSMWGDNPSSYSDSSVAMADPVTVPAGAKLSITHAYQFDEWEGQYFDGGVLEYSTGGPWQDAAALFAANGYNVSLEDGTPLGAVAAFGGVSLGYGESLLDLSSLAGQNVKFRFRIGTDNLYGSYGWFIDDVEMFRCVEPSVPPPPIEPPTTPESTTPPTTAPVAPVAPGQLRLKDTRKRAGAAWAAVPGATAYRATLKGRSAKGKRVTKKSESAKTSASFAVRLKKKSRFTVCVQAVNAAGVSPATCASGRR